jgi:predicted secreted hydrolase
MSKVVLRWLIPVLILALLVSAAAILFAPRQQVVVQASLVGLEESSSSEFARANGPVTLSFPRDYGPHPDFQTEWWYYTGNLETAEGRRFGYQLTFFRRAVQPAAERADRSSAWATEQVYLAHFTLTDVSGQRFRAFERLERGSAGLAGATGEPNYSVWLRDWSVEQVGPDQYRLRAAEGDAGLDLILTDARGIILQGEQGYSRKGPEPGNASIYYSQTRLEAQGTVTVGEDRFTVSGLSWLDREFSTSVLSQGQVGWDWFSVQLDNNSELMVYVLRRADGSVDEYSKGIYIAPDGSTRLLQRDDFSITSTGKWTSPHSGGVYPSGWKVLVPGAGLELEIEPLLKDQELNLSFIYWEGAVRVTGSSAGQTVNGVGYVELTGYARSMEGQF